ncbi:MAG TPA: TerB family tellurite resistance protein [Stellaceae bacterium]|nr:TerB family tellurite resistance protein [Stellaceae bacterium]
MLRKAMLDRLAAWLKEGQNSLSGAQDELQLAVAALLIGAARVDDGLDERERATIDRLLERRFGLSPEDARRIETAAERSEERSAQLFGFVRTINSLLPQERRVELIEMLWEVAYADGVLDPLEDTLLRRIGSMVDVSDRDRGAARLRVARRLGIAEEE